MPPTSSPRKQPKARQTEDNTTTTMSHQTAPKQNLQKKQISKQEYSFREEWAPETVNDYQLSHDEPAQYQHQHYQQQPPQQFHPHLQPHPHPHPPPHFQGQPQVVYPKRTSMQARIPNKRNQARSSSLFEEWKAKALRSPDKEKTTEADAPLVAANAPKTNRGRGRTGKSTVSGDVRVLLGEHSDNTVNIRSKTKESSVSIGLAVVPKEDNGQVEEPALSVAATGSHDEHFAKSDDAQVRTNETGTTSVETPKRYNSKKKGSTGTVGSQGPLEKDRERAGSKVKSKGPGTGPAEAPRDNKKREGSTTRARSRSEGPAVTSSVLPEKVSDDKGNTASTRARGGLGNKAVTLQPKDKPADDDQDQQPGIRNTGNSKEERHAFALSSDNTSTPIVDHEAATKNNPVRRGRPDRQRCEWERQDTRGRQRSLERQELYRGRSLERKPYTAPNGTLLGADELRKLALGTILKGTDKVYFIPCFIEDPWRGLTPVPSIRPSNLMSRF